LTFVAKIVAIFSTRFYNVFPGTIFCFYDPFKRFNVHVHHYIMVAFLLQSP
jgi:hypothetical protein